MNGILVSNKDELFTEKPSILDKYQRRSVEDTAHISELTYLQFCIKYMSTNQEPEPLSFKSLSFDTNQQEFQLTDNMDLIVTHDFLVNDVHYSLPKYIKLNDLRPGEPKYMKRRSRCVVRFHKINKTTSPHEFYYAQLQLYSPFRNENDLMPHDFDECKILYDEKSNHNGVSKIENVKSSLMKYLERVEVEKEKAEDLVSSDIGNVLDSALEQDNEDCLEMNHVDHPGLNYLLDTLTL